jgi:uncharacterized cupredoxin-like copper-binding protein
MKRTLVGAVAISAIATYGANAQAGRQPTAAKSPQGAALLKTVSVTEKEFKIVLSSKSAKRGIVAFKVKNVGALPHDFSISGRKTKLLKHGQSDTLRVTFLRKGTYPYKCTVSGHAKLGMKGVFTIS